MNSRFHRKLHMRHFAGPIALGAALTLAPLGCSLNKQSSSSSTVQTQNMEKERTLAHAKQAPTPRINPMTHLAAGRMLEGQGDPKGAIEQYERAIAASPKMAAGYNRLGMLYQKLGQFAQAETVFRSGIDAVPDSAALRNNRGYNFLLQKRFTEAEEQFLMALSLAPQFKRARMNLGIVYAQTGRLDQSLAQFQMVVSEDVAHYNLAVIRLAAGDRENAERSFRLALGANPNLALARQQLEKLAPSTALTAPGAPSSPPALIQPQATVPLNGPVAGTGDEEPLDEP